MKSKGKKPVLPVYVFILAWLACSLLFPLYKLWALALTTVLSAACAVAADGLIEAKRRKNGEFEEPQPVPQPEPKVSYGPEVDSIIAEGGTAMGEMKRLRESIKEPRVQAKIDELMDVSDKIVRDTVEDPSDVPQIKKFLSYYLPTTIKLLNVYDRMGAQGIEGENLTKSMQNIEDMLDTAIAAYRRQLDSLFANQALDIETDISVLNTMLAREGLKDGDGPDSLLRKAAGGK